MRTVTLALATNRYNHTASDIVEAVVFLSEAWMSRDPSTRPSESPIREEIIILFGEAYDAQKRKVLRVLRFSCNLQSDGYQAYAEPGEGIVYVGCGAIV